MRLFSAAAYSGFQAFTAESVMVFVTESLTLYSLVEVRIGTPHPVILPRSI